MSVIVKRANIGIKETPKEREVAHCESYAMLNFVSFWYYEKIEKNTLGEWHWEPQDSRGPASKCFILPVDQFIKYQGIDPASLKAIFSVDTMRSRLWEHGLAASCYMWKNTGNAYGWEARIINPDNIHKLSNEELNAFESLLLNMKGSGTKRMIKRMIQAEKNKRSV